MKNINVNDYVLVTQGECKGRVGIVKYKLGSQQVVIGAVQYPNLVLPMNKVKKVYPNVDPELFI